MPQYSFTLKNNNQKAFSTFFWFLYFLHVIAAAIIALKSTDAFQQQYAIGTLVFFIGFTVLVYFFKDKFKWRGYQPLILIVMILFWPFQSAWIPAIVFTVIIVFAWIVKDKKAIIFFSKNGIIIKNVLTKKHYKWSQEEYAVLKDGLLTINFKDNHFLQAETESNNPGEIDFNAFCNQYLEK